MADGRAERLPGGRVRAEDLRQSCNGEVFLCQRGGEETEAEADLVLIEREPEMVKGAAGLHAIPIHGAAKPGTGNDPGPRIQAAGLFDGLDVIIIDAAEDGPDIALGGFGLHGAGDANLPVPALGQSGYIHMLPVEVSGKQQYRPAVHTTFRGGRRSVHGSREQMQSRGQTEGVTDERKGIRV